MILGHVHCFTKPNLLFPPKSSVPPSISPSPSSRRRHGVAAVRLGAPPWPLAVPQTHSGIPLAL
eukprot:4253234-Pleurochrysis_carterae.AAC.2